MLPRGITANLNHLGHEHICREEQKEDYRGLAIARNINEYSRMHVRLIDENKLSNYEIKFTIKLSFSSSKLHNIISQ